MDLKEFFSEEVVVVHKERNPKADHSKIPIPDIRSSKYIGVFGKKENEVYYFQQFLTQEIDGVEAKIAMPNEIALSINIAKKSVDRAKLELIKLRKEMVVSNGKVIDSSVKHAYNYLEEIQTSIVFSYKSIESFCNALIPTDYIYKKINNKGVIEHYPREQIERWINTSEKLSEILPKLITGSDPKSQKMWGDFKGLEKLRNEVVHSKSTNSSETLSQLFSNNVYKKIESAQNILEYFVLLEPNNSIFPLGVVESKVEIINVDSISDVIR